MILSVPIKISESIDKLNISSGYYNDICYTTSSDSGTDITLNDRKKQYMKRNNIIICQEGCDFFMIIQIKKLIVLVMLKNHLHLLLRWILIQLNYMKSLLK